MDLVPRQAKGSPLLSNVVKVGAFLTVTFPVWLAAVWPLFSDRPFAVVMVESGLGFIVVGQYYGWFCLAVGVVLSWIALLTYRVQRRLVTAASNPVSVVSVASAQAALIPTANLVVGESDAPPRQLPSRAVLATDIRVELHGKGTASVLVWNTTDRPIKIEGTGQIRPETEGHYNRSTPFALDWEGHRHKHQIEVGIGGYATAIVAKPHADRRVKLWLCGDDSIVDSWEPDSPMTVLLRITIRDASSGTVLWEKPCELKFWPSGATFKFLLQDA